MIRGAIIFGAGALGGLAVGFVNGVFFGFKVSEDLKAVSSYEVHVHADKLTTSE
jgi:hypothetical protein